MRHGGQKICAPKVKWRFFASKSCSVPKQQNVGCFFSSRTKTTYFWKKNKKVKHLSSQMLTKPPDTFLVSGVSKMGSFVWVFHCTGTTAVFLSFPIFLNVRIPYISAYIQEANVGDLDLKYGAGCMQKGYSRYHSKTI